MQHRNTAVTGEERMWRKPELRTVDDLPSRDDAAYQVAFKNLIGDIGVKPQVLADCRIQNQFSFQFLKHFSF